MSDGALWRFGDDIFTFPNILLWATVVALALAIIFQLVEIFTVFSGKNLNLKTLRLTNLFTIAECICAILMFVMFWIFLFFGFFPRIALIIMPVAVVCQILFSKNVKIIGSGCNGLKHHFSSL
jgi:hypothetical protein